MSVKRLFLVILFLAIGCQKTVIGADKTALVINDTISDSELSTQLKINRDALLRGTSEQIRIDAATVMLFSEDSMARKILLNTLKTPENSAAQLAVCKALSMTRGSQKSIKNKQDFIQPLLELLVADDSAVARLAAEATLIFDYSEISGQLEKIVKDRSLPTKTRQNVIDALKLQPDIGAIFQLMELLDDPDKEVIAAAEEALQSSGIPVGKDTETRKQIIKELNRKGTAEFRRDWLILQDKKMSELETKLHMWQERCLAALGKIYDGISDDTRKGQYLAEQLVDPEAPIRLWALEKVSQWRLGTKSKLPNELNPILINLVSDQNRDVRLKTAKLLSLMGELNSSEKLLQQLNMEKDDEVKTELFVALGVACYYAFLPNSGINIPPEIRVQTLELASEFLGQQDPKKAQRGAEVIKKLLEQNGLASADVSKYLNLLVERYKQEKDKADGALRGELVNAMAKICVQSICKDEAKVLYEPLFTEALYDKTDLVREAAVDGLIYIDKTKALKKLRKEEFVNDSSIVVRKKVINLAGEVGGNGDLVWLAEKLSSTDEGESAWQGMLKIFKNSDATVLAEWMDKLDSKNSAVSLTNEQIISFLEIAEKKAVGENKTKILKHIREKLADTYIEISNFELAAKYLGMLLEEVKVPEQRDEILTKLLEVFLSWGNLERASQLIANRLLEGNLDPNNPVMLSIDSYLAEPPLGADPNAMFDKLAQIEAPKTAAVMWEKQLRSWAGRLGLIKTKNLNKVEETH